MCKLLGVLRLPPKAASPRLHKPARPRPRGLQQGPWPGHRAAMGRGVPLAWGTPPPLAQPPPTSEDAPDAVSMRGRPRGDAQGHRAVREAPTGALPRAAEALRERALIAVGDDAGGAPGGGGGPPFYPTPPLLRKGQKWQKAKGVR